MQLIYTCIFHDPFIASMMQICVSFSLTTNNAVLHVPFQWALKTPSQLDQKVGKSCYVATNWATPKGIHFFPMLANEQSLKYSPEQVF